MLDTQTQILVKAYLNKGGKIIRLKPGYAKTEARRFKYSIANQGRKALTLKGQS